MNKKLKHWETCPHCAFMRAFKTKYGATTAGLDEKQVRKAYARFFASAELVASIAFKCMPTEDQALFIKRIAEAGGAEVSGGPTKH